MAPSLGIRWRRLRSPQPDSTTMCCGDRPTDGQAEAETIAFRSGERLKQARGNVGGYAGTVVPDGDHEIRWPIGTLRRKSNTPAAHLRSSDRVDRVANKVEDDLLELATISAKRWKVILDYEINANLRRRCLRSDEHENILQQAADVNVTHERPAMQKLADASHNVAGRVYLADERREIVVSPCQVRGGAAQDVLNRPGERPNRGDRLVDFMGERRCHGAYQIEACGPNRVRLLPFEPLFGVLECTPHLLAFADDGSDRQRRCGQDEHECLELGEGSGVKTVALEQEHESDLCHKKAKACAVEALPDRRDDDREKQHVKEIRAVLAAGVEDQPETRRNQVPRRGLPPAGPT